MMRCIYIVIGVLLLVNFIFCHPVDKNPFKSSTTKAPSNDSTFESVDIANISKAEHDTLEVERYNLNRALLELISKRHQDSNAGSKILLPSEIAKMLKLEGNPEVDVEFALKKIKEHLEEIDKKELNMYNEVEIGKVLDRWEDHVNDTAAEIEKAKREFEAKKAAMLKKKKFKEPGSLEMEKEVWKEEDEMPVDNFSPRNFFLMHDVNSDGVWDSEEIEAVLDSQFDALDEDRPELASEYRIQMRQHLMKLVDKNKDGVIDYKEHMDYVNSSDAAVDDGWMPDDDEDEDLDDFGPSPSDRDLEEMAAKIRHFEKVDPDSEVLEQLKDRFVHLKREIEWNRSHRT